MQQSSSFVSSNSDDDDDDFEDEDDSSCFDEKKPMEPPSMSRLIETRQELSAFNQAKYQKVLSSQERQEYMQRVDYFHS